MKKSAGVVCGLFIDFIIYFRKQLKRFWYQCVFAKSVTLVFVSVFLMSPQSKTMPVLDLKVYIRVVAGVFSISSTTAFVMALVRLLNPELYYLEALAGTDIVIHYFISGLMIVASAVGFLNSCVVMNRSSALNIGKNLTTWLLLDSLFETSRVVYVFVCEVVLKGKGTLQAYELLVSAAQYLLDSFLYCQMILRH